MKPAFLDEFTCAGIEFFLDGGQLKAGIRRGYKPPPELIAKAKGMKAEIIGALQKPKYPAVWHVVLAGSGRGYSMTVIDPEQLSDDGFMGYLAEKFGAGRVVSARRRTGAGANQSLSS